MRPIHAGRVLIHGLLAALAGSGLAGCGIRAEPPHKPPPPMVTVVAARKMIVPEVVRRQGTTRAINDVTIRARVKGFLEEPLFKEGTNVKKGQLLLIIEEEPYQVKLDQAKANLDESVAELKKAEHSKAREVAQAQLLLDEAQRSLDQIEEKRERSLLARNAATIEDVERKQALLKKSSAQVEADQASLEQARADYETNRLSAKAKVEAARAAVRDAEINLAYCRMEAPIDGKIGQALVRRGNVVGPDQNTDLVTIQQLDPMGVDINPPARALPLITKLMKTGQTTISLRVEGEREYLHQGTIYFVDNTVEPTTGTVLVRASVPNPDESMLPGEYVQFSAKVGEYHDVIVVPEKAVIEGQAGPTVYVVDQSKRVSSVRVKPIAVYRGMRVIESGLEPDQKVIVEGIQLVRPGLTVDVEVVPLDSFFRDANGTDEDDRYESPKFQVPSSPGERPEEPAKKSPADPR